MLLDRPLAAAGRPGPRFPAGPSAAALTWAGIDRFPGRYVAGFVEILLIALVGFQCMTLLGVVVTRPEPLPPGASHRPGRTPPSTILTSYDPFFPKAGASSAPLLAATDLELYGIRQDGRTGRGSAIISEGGGPQRSFGVGEAISPGIVLKNVGAGYATVARHGVDERLAFASFASVSPKRPPEMSGPSIAGMPAASRGPPSRPQPLPAARQAAPPRSVDFADPSTLPASLKTPAG